MTEAITVERTMLELAVKEWTEMKCMGERYTHQVQRDVRRSKCNTHTHACARTHFLSPLMLQLFCDAFIEDPYFVCEIAQSCLAKQEQDTNVRTNQAEKARKMCEAAANVIDVRICIYFYCPNIC